MHWEIFENQSINKFIFKALLEHVRESLRLRRASLWSNIEEYLIHMDNASPHHALIVKNTLQAMNWSVLKHPPYSPDLSPADFFLFPRLKKKLKGINFPNIQSLRQAIDTELGLIASWEWQACFDDWLTRCRKCVLHEGHYFEGMKHPP